MIDIGLAGAFLGGLFALVSPCSAPGGGTARQEAALDEGALKR